MHLLNSLRKLKLVQIHNQGDLLSIINQTKLSHRVACIRYNATSIFALASGANQRCGVAVVRLSGRATLNVLLSLSKSADLTSFEPRRLYLRNLWHPVTHEKIDRAIVVWFKGEDICEFHVHGGPAVISSLFSALCTFKEVRYAEPGEFSRRSFVNGRMDLVEVEGLADLINAETAMQKKQALAQMEGHLSQIYNSWRSKCLKCLANLEAYIDFSEEENVEDNVLVEVKIKVNELIVSIEAHLNDNRKGERLRDGVRVVIVGQPNAGKSSLLNSICNRPAAIVSSIPGTTRDVIDSAVNIAGYPVLLSDTAGLRHTSDLVEMEGVKRAYERIESADIIIFLIDVRQHFDSVRRFGFDRFISDHMREQMSLQEMAGFEEVLENKEIIVAFNKKDLLDLEQIKILDNQVEQFLKQSKSTRTVLVNKISCIDKNSGIEDLLNQLKSKTEKLCLNEMNETPMLTQQRHRDMLERCVQCLREYLQKVEEVNVKEHDFALDAEELRLAAKWLGYTTGTITNEDVLDVIFKDFCIGK